MNGFGAFWHRLLGSLRRYRVAKICHSNTVENVINFPSLRIPLRITIISHLGSPYRPKRIQAKSSNNAQSNRKGLLRLDRSRDATRGQHQTSQQGHFQAVRLAVTYAETTEAVLRRRQHTVQRIQRVEWRKWQRTRAPTVMPAVTEGIEPVRI